MLNLQKIIQLQQIFSILKKKMRERNLQEQNQTLQSMCFEGQNLLCKSQQQTIHKISASNNIQKKCQQQIASRINLDEIIKNSNKWTFFDEQLLINLHKHFGNKWAKIATKFQNRSQDQIKNRFYSRMRKSVRVLNNMIVQFCQHKQKLLSLNIIFKITNLISYKVNQPNLVSPQVLTYYENFLYKFLELSNEHYPIQESTKQKIMNLILPLKALESLIYFLGESRKSTKKKKFNKHIRNNMLKLSTQSQECLNITKSGCFIIKLSQAEKLKKVSKQLCQGQTANMGIGIIQMVDEQKQQQFQQSQYEIQSQFCPQKKLQNLLESQKRQQLQPNYQINFLSLKKNCIEKSQEKTNKTIQSESNQMRIVDDFQSQTCQMDLFDQEIFVSQIYTDLF